MIGVHKRSTLPASPQVVWLALITIAGITLYVLIDAVLNFLPPHYSLVSQPESDYAVGPYGFLMTINFVIRGLFSFVLLAGLYRGTRATGRRSRLGLILLGIWTVGAFLLAAFPTSLDIAHPTTTGSVHGAIAFTAFLCVAVGELLLSSSFGDDERWRSLRRPATIIAGATLVAFVAFSITLVAAIATAYGADIPFGLGSVVGLSERIFLGLALLWMLMAALRLRAIAVQARRER